MPVGMPYHLEKGPTLRLLEHVVNGNADDMRKRLERLTKQDEGLKWLFDEPIWSDPRFDESPQGSGNKVAEAIAREWFGFDDKNGSWKPVEDAKTTGYWIAYRGAVEKIVRRTLAWATRLALGVDEEGKGGRSSDPWTIELFWKCPSPWFEGWVVSRPVGPETHDSSGRRTNTGLVTVVFLTPSHWGSNVAESPLAVGDNPTMPDIPFRVPSNQPDYEVVWPAQLSSTTLKPPAVDRQHATWVVTHKNHVTAGKIQVTTQPSVPSDFSDWGIPQLSIYSGYGANGEEPVVVVSPSMAAGGVRNDGSVA